MKIEADAHDAISLLIRDHREVDNLFAQAERAGISSSERRNLIRKITQELSKHAAVEEQIFYPTVRELLKDDDLVDEGLEEHEDVKRLLLELEKADPSSDEFESALTDLIEQVRHHVSEEESEMLPRIASAMEADALRALGKRMEEAKTIAPTRPHPDAPAIPPGNVAAALVSGLIDRTRDAAEKIGDKVRPN